MATKTYISGPHHRGYFGSFKGKRGVKSFRFVKVPGNNIFQGGHGSYVTDDEEVQAYLESLEDFGVNIMLKGERLPKYEAQMPDVRTFDDDAKQKIVDDYIAQQKGEAFKSVDLEKELKDKLLRFGELKGKLLKNDGTYNQKNIELAPEYEALKAELGL